MFFSKRKRIVKKAVAKTAKAYAEKTPKIYEHFFYGEFDLNPQNLAIWYLFETDAELELAKASGLCGEIEEATKNNLISSGYPREAFVPAETDFSADRTAGGNCTDEEIQSFFDSLSNRKAKVSFTTQEDIDKKANGDYHLYFQ